MSETKLGTSQLGNDEIVWNKQNLVAGENTDIIKIQRPYIDNETVALFHCDELVDNKYIVDCIHGAQTDGGKWTYALGSVAKFGAASWDLVSSNYNADAHLAIINEYISTDFTVDFWFYVEANKTPLWSWRLQSGGTAIQSYTNYQSGYVSNKTITFYSYQYNGTSLSFTGTVDSWTAGWHHAAFCFDSNSLLGYLFVDGNLLNSGSLNALAIKGFAMLGRGQWDSSSSYTSLVDEVRISNVCRWKSDFTPFELPYQDPDGSADIYKIIADPYQAGTNIQIDQNKVISATDTTYTAGKGINITGTVVKVDQENVWTPDNFLAGTGIEFEKQDSPLIDQYTTGLWHLDGTTKNEITGVDPTPSWADAFVDNGKFGKAYWCSTNTSTNSLQGTPYYRPTQQSFTFDVWLSPRSATGTLDWRIGYDLGSVHIAPSGQISLDWKVAGLASSSDTASVTVDFEQLGIVYAPGTYIHVAYENDLENRTIYLFLNGHLVYKKVNATLASDTANMYALYYQNGYIDEARVSNIVRWREDFTPWTVPYSADGVMQYKIKAVGGGSISPVVKTFNKAADVTTIDTGLDLASYSLVLVYSNGLCLSEDPVIESGESTESGESGEVETNDYYISGSSIIFHEGFAAKIKVVCM